MARRKANEEETDQTTDDTGAGGDSAESPLMESVDDRQLATAQVTATPDETDVRVGTVTQDPKDNPAAPDDVSNTADPEDPMTLTKGDDPQGGNA